MLQSAKEEYEAFLERQKHFRPEDRLEFIQNFLTRYCCTCGGILTGARCGYCSHEAEEPAKE